jgi:hypothetical protein
MLAVQLCGKRTEDWPGKQIVLYPTMVSFKGQVAEAIRIKPAPLPTAEALNDNIEF